MLDLEWLDNTASGSCCLFAVARKLVPLFLWAGVIRDSMIDVLM
jgi:hypothetical protein